MFYSENVLKNFVSSRDPIHWKTYAEDYFIPHLYKLFENHSSLSKLIVQIDDSDSEMIIDPPTTLSRKDSVIIDLLDDERTKRKRGKDIVNLSNELPLNSSDVIEVIIVAIYIKRYHNLMIIILEISYN